MNFGYKLRFLGFYLEGAINEGSFWRRKTL
jgi:hypothetical protein